EPRSSRRHEGNEQSGRILPAHFSILPPLIDQIDMRKRLLIQARPEKRFLAHFLGDDRLDEGVCQSKAWRR
ncbi:MAG TPA: hypothetical protein VIL63_03085, partial [Terriglobales bacterium]